MYLSKEPFIDSQNNICKAISQSQILAFFLLTYLFKEKILDNHSDVVSFYFVAVMFMNLLFEIYVIFEGTDNITYGANTPMPYNEHSMSPLHSRVSEGCPKRVQSICLESGIEIAAVQK